MQSSSLAILFFLIYRFTVISQELEPETFLLPHEEVIPLKDTAFNKHHVSHEHVSINLLEPILSAESEPLTTVEGCVNVLSGHFFQIEEDLTDNTIEPLSLIRYYDSGNDTESFLGFGFGSQFPLWASALQDSARHSYALISAREGVLIPYQSRADHHERTFCLIDPRFTSKGATNLNRAALSGRANVVNWKAIYRARSPSLNSSWTISLGDGSKWIYDKAVHLEDKQLKRMKFPTQKAYLLTQEIKPNGNKCLYSYLKLRDKIHLAQIITLNRADVPLNSLHFDYSSEGCTVTNACGETVNYLQSEEICLTRPEKLQRKTLKQVKSSHGGNYTYHSRQDHGHRKVVKIDKPEGRFIEIHYDETTHQVRSLYEPKGNQGEKVRSYHFNYQKGSTQVWDALDHLKVYHFDSHQRLLHIRDLDKQLHILRQENYEWSTREGQEGWLRSKSIGKGEHLYHVKSYRYDTRGNVTRATLYGNLTGEKKHSFKIHEMQEMDRDFIAYTYTDDERNLLQERLTSLGDRTTYTYLPSTNLCVKILHEYNGNIQEREFFTYDENGQLLLAIEDDGSGLEATDLTNVTFVNYQTVETVKELGSAAYGKPQQIAFHYRDAITGALITLNSTEFLYDAKGLEISQKVYDSQHSLCYELTKNYDSHGRLIQESNPIGRLIHYEWDKNNNKIQEKFGKSGKKVQYDYDLANRLIVKREIHRKGEIFTTSYSYNALSQLIAETDPYGHQTTYHYDELGHQIQVIKPPMQGPGQLIQPTLTYTYHCLGQIKSQTNENGFTTTYSYNSYGSPTKITHPDGATERFAYYPCGWLKQKWGADGTSVHYNYDAKGHLLKERTFDSQASLLKEEDYGYKGSLLIYKKDASGLITTYAYDGAGRKIEEKIGKKVTRYSYDDFNRLNKCEQENRQEIFQYDALDRLIVKKWQDTNGTLFAQENYAYDKEGHQIKKTIEQSTDQLAVYQSHYHTDGSLDWQENPLGQRTSWFYDHHFINGLGQQVQSRTKLDPLGRPSRETDDVYHRLNTRDLYEGEQQLSHTHFEYDATGKLLKQHAVIMTEGNPLREYWIQQTYNQRELLESETEMPVGKTTRYRYDACGRLILKQKPDNVQLHFTYDPLGRLQTLASSDGTIAYSYAYDWHDNIVQVHDQVHQIIQRRNYNEADQLIQEELSSGVVLNYQYDGLDRLTSMTLPDGPSVSYTYNPYRLTNIQRLNAYQELLYAIDLTYDQRGNLLSSRSPTGRIDTTYDLLGQAIAIESPEWTSYLEQFDAVGNLLKMKQTDPSGTLNSQFAYDRFDHLSHESSTEVNHYVYDSIGNCLCINAQATQINALNQFENTGTSVCTYDTSGNLKTESNPAAHYTYDALNRLIKIDQEGHCTHFLYDAFNRCLQINDQMGTRQLLYQGLQEIGSIVNGQVQEFRLVHPEAEQERTFAIELKGEIFFPLQDFRGNICALQKQNGSFAQWYRYSAFGAKLIKENLHEIFNPWRFANRREVSDLSLFTHRLYNPRLMRWQTGDPLRFEDGLNLYHYVHNNPFCYKDPDGQFAIPFPLLLPFLEITFGTTATITILPAIGASLACAAIGYSCYQLAMYTCNQINLIEPDEIEKEKEKEQKSIPLKENEKSPKRHTPNQEAISDLVKESAKEGISNIEANILLDWAKEYDFPNRDDRGKPPHWIGGEHIHVGPKHIPVHN